MCVPSLAQIAADVPEFWIIFVTILIPLLGVLGVSYFTLFFSGT
jgi:hypothetical protein